MLIVQPATWGVASPATDWLWAQTRDGLTLTAQGCDPAALLPQDTDVVLVLPVLALSWHRVTLPKIAASRLRVALDGLLEDRLLTEPARLHLAVQPGAVANQPAWVCACDKDTLAGWLDALQSAQRQVGRIVPDQAPQPQPEWTALATAGQSWWVHAGPLGVRLTPLNQVADPQAARPSAGASLRTEPGCASAAEAAADRPVQLETPAQRLLRSAQSGWNLAQFDIRHSAHTRRGQLLVQVLRRMAYAPAWRAARWGLLVLAVSSLLGLGTRAWDEHRALAAKRQQIQTLLGQTFPHITLVLDAPLQMRREVDRLQRASGGVGQADLDVFLADFSASSLDGIGFNAIQFSATDIRITLTGVNDSNLAQLQSDLQLKGWQARYAAPALTLTRTAPAVAVQP